MSAPVEAEPVTARVLICDALSEEAREIFAERGIPAEVRTGLGEDELVRAVAGVEALVVRSATKVTRRVIAAAPRLAVVGRAGVGVDNVDLDAATEHGVVVLNAPAGNTTATAELALALLLSLARNVPRADRAVRSGAWRKGGLVGSELTGKTLGVVGLGRIGRALAERALGLRMEVLAHDPYIAGAGGIAGAKAPVEGVDMVGLDELLERSDFVSLHLPLSDETRHLLSRERLARMKRGARLINAARGGLVDEAALLEALESGRLRGAALDVFEREPPPVDHPLLAREDVVLTPHLGASSDEAQRSVAVEIAREVCDFLEQGVAQNAVNAPPLSRASLREIAPYVRLAERMGSFLAQRCRAPLRVLEVALSGEIAGKDAGHVRLALLAGALRHGSEGPVNYVNAPRLAAERGLALVVAAPGEPEFLHGLVEARAFAGEASHRVAGTVFGREPRFVEVDGVRLDLVPGGPLLLTRHRDQPGVVGLLGTVLGRYGINIKRIELGPTGEGGAPAAGFLSLYADPPREVLEEIAALEPMRDVQLVHL
ncbi:MAG TPA: phosphoglycerate dehydrogenase [Planctomycetota bacterium]|nr:phosphoglycerate dehydrogenase [Planctomycetota bacterium]